MPITDCRQPHTTESKSVFITVVLVLIFCFFGLIPFTVSEGWAKDVTLEWDPNTEPDLGGYIVHYGTETGIYDNSLDVGNFTSAVISGLDPDTEYYFSVSAYSLEGLTSALSNEVSTALVAAPAQYSSAGTGGGGSGCFISAAGDRSLTTAGMTLKNSLKTWWREVGKAAAAFKAWSQLENKPLLQ